MGAHRDSVDLSLQFGCAKIWRRKAYAMRVTAYSVCSEACEL